MTLWGCSRSSTRRATAAEAFGVAWFVPAKKAADKIFNIYLMKKDNQIPRLCTYKDESATFKVERVGVVTTQFVRLIVQPHIVHI
jgi:hypothetical protein